MRVAFVTNFIPPYRKTFYERLARLPGIDLLVVRGCVDQETGRPDYRGPIAAPTAEVRNVEREIGPLTVRFQRGVLTAVRAHRAEVLVLLGMVGNVSNWLLLAWARLTGKRVLVWACGWEPQAPGSLAWRVKQVLMRRYFGAADMNLVYSTKGLNYLAACGVPREQIQVCFNGLDIEPMRASERGVREKAPHLRTAHAADADYVFLYVGGLLDEKRVDLLIEAFSDVRRTRPGAVLWIVGDGPSRTALESQAKGVSGIRFFGRIVDDVEPYFAAANAFVLPGIGGLAINQAMFWGTPCIVSVADGTEDDLVLDGITGWRFAAGDAASLAAAMLRASDTPSAERSTIAETARAAIEKRSNVEQMVACFEASLAALKAGR